MLTNLKSMFAALCLALSVPLAVAQTAPATAQAAPKAAAPVKEFVPASPNVATALPSGVAAGRSGGGTLTPIPEPGSLALVAAAALAGVAVMRRKKK